MSAFLQFKQWFTIPEAIKQINNITNEKIDETFLYNLAKDDHITLSINIPKNAYIGQMMFKDTSDDPLNYNRFDATFFSDSDYIIIDNEVFQFKNKNANIDISGIWDIAKDHHTEEYNFLIDILQAYLNGDDVVNIDRINLISGDRLTYATALHHKNKSSSSQLKWSLNKTNINQAEICIRTENLKHFLNTLIQNNPQYDQNKIDNNISIFTTNDTQEEKKLTTKEKNSLLGILAIFLQCNHEMGDIRETPKYSLANIITSLGDQYGITTPSKNTIVKYLDEAKDLIPQNKNK